MRRTPPARHRRHRTTRWPPSRSFRGTPGQERAAGHAHHLAVRVGDHRLDDQELVRAPGVDIRDPRCGLEHVPDDDGPAPLVLLLPVDHPGVVEAQLLVHDHLPAGHDLHHRGERGRGQLLGEPGGLSGLGVAVQRVPLSDGVGELHHPAPLDLEGDLPVLLALELVVEGHVQAPSWPPDTGRMTPEMKSASSLARKRWALATSSGWPYRWRAISISAICLTCSGTPMS